MFIIKIYGSNSENLKNMGRYVFLNKNSIGKNEVQMNFWSDKLFNLHSIIVLAICEYT